MNRKGSAGSLLALWSAAKWATKRFGARLFLLFSLGGLCFGASAAGIINLGLDEATPRKYNTAIDTVFISNPEVADYQVVKGNQLIIYGKTMGSTTLVVMDANGNVIDNKTLVVNKSLAFIRQQVKIRFPDEEIEILNLGDQVILSGTVKSEATKENIYILVGELMAKSGEDLKFNWNLGSESLEIDFMTKRRFEGLVNNIKVDHVKQVNVKVTIAEVSQKFQQELGIRWGGANGLISGSANLFPIKDALWGISSKDIAYIINAADNDNVGQILAEPNLSVISGETASFLVGGELPIVVTTDNKITIQYKEVGIKLQLAAKVFDDQRINLSMMPEVSTVDPSYTNGIYPGFSSRKARTTVQLADGESFVLGGLLDSQETEALAKIPGIGDLPVIGALFRHTTNERTKKELIIVATVNLVKPVPAGTIQIPRIKRTNSLQRFLRLDLPGSKGVLNNTPAYKQATQTLANGGFKS